MERYAEKRLQLFDYQSKVTEQVKDDKHKVSGQGPYIICVDTCLLYTSLYVLCMIVLY